MAWRPNEISDSALDAWYSRDYYGPGRDYFHDGPEDEDRDPDGNYIDDEEPWEKPSEREVPA